MKPRLFRTLAVVAMLLPVACSSASDDDASEAPDEAEIVSSKVPIRGSITFGQDINAAFDASRSHGYTFTGSKGSKIDVALTGDIAQGTDTVLAVYGPKSTKGYGRRPFAKDDNGGGSKFSKLSEVALEEDGDYLIAATCKGRSCAGKTYTLALGCASGTCEPGTTPPPASKGTIHVEVDYVGYQRFEPETVKLVTDYFASIGYAITFEDSDTLEPIDLLPFGQKSAVLQSYYVTHFNHRGENGWYYMLMADKLEYSNRGWGLLGGDMFEISADPLVVNPTNRAKAQANIILHELGHNLGLVHEGFDGELSAGTHNKGTCATADRSADDGVDPLALRYSPACVEHITLDSIKMVK